MLSLQSQIWSELHHAYGSAADIPALLGRLAAFTESGGIAEPWHSLWSALAHQGDVYPASFAAVPHVITILATAPTLADVSFFQFPAWVEICRAKTRTEIPQELKGPYFEALARLPGLVAQASEREWSPGFLACALSAIAAAKGHHEIAEAVMEITSSSEAEKFLNWFFEQ